MDLPVVKCEGSAKVRCPPPLLLIIVIIIVIVIVIIIIIVIIVVISIIVIIIIIVIVIIIIITIVNVSLNCLTFLHCAGDQNIDSMCGDVGTHWVPSERVPTRVSSKLSELRQLVM